MSNTKWGSSGRLPALPIAMKGHKCCGCRKVDVPANCTACVNCAPYQHKKYWAERGLMI